MSRYYVACDLDPEYGRVMLGTLHKGELTMSEIRRFQNAPKGKNGSGDIPHMYREILEGLRLLGEHDEPVNGISCHSWGGDYLYFKSDGTLTTPSLSHDDARAEAGMKKVLSRIPAATIYEDTGTQLEDDTTLFQLGAERGLRFGRARYLLPVADAFNYMLSGVPRIETTQAGATQMFNPVSRTWSDRLLKAAGISSRLLPPVVNAGTELGPLREEVAKQTNVTEARVLASCSHERAASLAGLPLHEGENWACLWPGATTLIGTQLAKPFINEASREMGFSNELGYRDSVLFCKRTIGLSILDECRRFWKEKDREIDDDLLSHLAASAPPFEALINPADPRFLTPGDMPLKVQAYCKETRQEVPWKPGPVIRCVLESLALLYRKVLTELDYLTGRATTRLCFFGPPQNILLKSFIANALQLPTLIAPSDAAAIGNVVAQAVALGHINSVKQAHEIVKHSIKMETMMPHATVWNSAYQRFVELAVA